MPVTGSVARRPGPPGDPPQVAGAPVIEAVDASLGYQGVTVLRGLNLIVRGGERVALVGANGSGKSTLVRAVLGLAERHDGVVRLFGAPVDQVRDRARVGYVPQHLSIGSGLPATVREVVATGRLARTRAWWPRSRADRAAIEAAVDAVGLRERLASPVVELSGGQQRRVLIARALAGEPELLILDEPTAGVDLANQRILAQALARLAATGSTMLVVTHDLAPFAGLFTRVIRMGDGRIEADVPAEVAATSLRPDEQPGAAQAHTHGRTARVDTGATRTGLTAPEVGPGRPAGRG